MSRSRTAAPSPRRRMPPASRAAATNGALPGNGNSSAGRRFRDLVESYEAMAPAGEMTTLRRAVCRRCAMLSMMIEDAETAIANGLAADHDALVRLVGLEQRLVRQLAPPQHRTPAAVEPKPRHEPGSLEAFIAEKYGASVTHPSLDPDAAPVADDADDGDEPDADADELASDRDDEHGESTSMEDDNA